MTRRLISTGSPFEAAAAYSRAVVAGDWCFVSGTTGYDYATMRMSDDVAAQARAALTTLERSLEQAGFALADVVRVTYYLARREDLNVIAPVLRETFGAVRPAATCVIVQMIEPAMLIEIEVTALKGAADGCRQTTAWDT